MIYDFNGQSISLPSGNPDGIFDAVRIETSQQFWFTGANTAAYGTVGQVMACKAGEKFFWNGKLASSGSYTAPRMLSALPDASGIYDSGVTIGAVLAANEDGSYTAAGDGAVFFPAVFSNGSSIENYMATGYTYLGGGSWFIQKGAQADPFYLKNDPGNNYVFGLQPSVLTLAGLLKHYIPMIGAKAAVLGDSLSEQSAGDGSYDHEGWFARIARKYNMDYRVHGYGMQWWYCTDARPNGGVKGVNSLIESGYVPNYIILEYGTNDIWTGTLGDAADPADAAAASTVGAMRYCIETLQAQFPAAKILVIMPCMRGVNDEKQAQYYELVSPILREYGVRCVDMLGESGIVRSMMNQDGVHLAAVNADNSYDNDTEAVARYSRCLETAMLAL